MTARLSRNAVATVLSSHEMELFDLLQQKIDQYKERSLHASARGVLAAQALFVQHALGLVKLTDKLPETDFGDL